MTPMRANSDNEVANPSAGDSRSGPLSSPATAQRDGGATDGSVGAAAAAVEEDSNSPGPGSVALLRGEITGGKLPVSGRTRTDELLAELQEISGQVNRMMAQVDRAIDRLGEHAGEPLRR
jgi:hypothetical protein